MSKPTMYRWVTHGGARLENVGIAAGGALHNPNGYPDELVRAAVLAANERRRQKRSRAALKAAETRCVRHERDVYNAARAIVRGHNLGPRSHCACCGRALDDPRSVARGIGSECWERVLAALTEMRQRQELER